jgi:hypothetical protein
MTVAGILLVAVGLTDLLRGRSDVGQPAGSRRWPALGAGLALIVVLAALAGASALADVLLLLVAAGVLVSWVLSEDDARQHQRRHGLPVGLLLGGLVVLIAASGWASQRESVLSRWLAASAFDRLAVLPADRFLLLLGLALVQLSTGNRLVRLVLTSTGALRVPSSPQPADRLRGGRLLGSMERIFILGLGLAGQVTAAGIVIAAKGIIRWPELQATPPDQRVGVDEVTEYFLIGSFTSWLLALGSLWLAA